jgi:hypothetical protein
MSAGNGQSDPDRIDDSLDALGSEVPAAPPLSDELARELAAMEPVRSRVPGLQLAVVLAVSLLYAVALIALSGIRRDLGELPWLYLVGSGLLWLGSFAAILYLVVVPPRGHVMPRPRTAAAVAGIAALLIVGLGLLMPVAGASDGGLRGPCARWGLAGAVVPIALAAVAVRGAIPVGSRWAAAALGAAGGALGGLVLHLHCPLGGALHLGVVHGGLVVIAALVSAAAGRLGAPAAASV